MITHARTAPVPHPQWVHQQDFEYWGTPRPGLNWPFAQKMILSFIVWSSAAVSAVSWGCLLVAILR